MCFATVYTSLSPRPERLTMTVLSFSASAFLIAQATAWEDSSAGRQDTFYRAQLPERVQRLIVRGIAVLCPTDVPQHGMFRTDGSIVQAGGDAVRIRDLAVLVLQHVGIRPMKHAFAAAVETGGVFAGVDTAASRLYADQPYGLVFKEAGEDADGVAAAADTGNDAVRKMIFLFEDLRSSASRPMTLWKSLTMAG